MGSWGTLLSRGERETKNRSRKTPNHEPISGDSNDKKRRELKFQPTEIYRRYLMHLSGQPHQENH